MTRPAPRPPTPHSRAPPRWARPTPTSASTATAGNRSRRASGRCRACRGRPATASGSACWSTARGASPRPIASIRPRRAQVADQAVAIARANAVLTSRKVVLADADKVVTTWANPIKRDPFEVPLEAKTAFLMKLNETAMAVPGVSFVSSQLLFVDEQKYFASSEGSRITQRLVRTYPQFTHHRVRSRLAATFKRARSSIGRSSSATSTSRTTRGCRMPRRPATKWSRS